MHETFLERLFDADAWPAAFPELPSRPELIDRLLRGAYPEIVTEALPARARRDWFEAYIRDVVSREAFWSR